jgi:PAS domain S-box-containing protein
MKTQETIRLNLAATIIAGVITSLLMLCGVSGRTGAASHVATALSIMPLLLAGLAAFYQYRYVMLPWRNTLGELAAKSATLQDTESTAPPTTRDDHLNQIRESLETASVQYKEIRKREMALIQHAVDVICVIDMECRIISVNPAARTVWGYKPEELKGRLITDFLETEDVKNTMKKMILGSEKSVGRMFFENRFRKKSGDVIDLLWSAHLSVSDQGLFCIAHDITERKRAERMLKDSEERIRTILQSLPAGVAVVNPDGKIGFMNKTALQLTGQSEESFGEQPAAGMFSFMANGPVPQGQTSASQPSVQPSGQPTTHPPVQDASFDCQITRASGEKFSAEASICNINWGTSTSTLVVFVDATTKLELEQAKREFVAMVSHDLRTPLTTISLVFSYLIDGLGGKLTEDGIELATKGLESSQRLVTLVKDLLDLEKMRAGKFVMEITAAFACDLIASAISSVEPYADTEQVELQSFCADEQCLCDGGRIIQVLINLIGNAIKYSPPQGKVVIETRGDDSFVTFTVTNRGRTIPADKLRTIFEKFEQVDAAAAEERKGTGLGLAISKTLVEQHGGKIWAESSAEEGTRFLFTLPAIPRQITRITGQYKKPVIKRS